MNKRKLKISVLKSRVTTESQPAEKSTSSKQGSEEDENGSSGASHQQANRKTKAKGSWTRTTRGEKQAFTRAKNKFKFCDELTKKQQVCRKSVKREKEKKKALVEVRTLVRKTLRENLKLL